jgi:hypothetical protein
MHSSHPPVQ